jgi:hypothetical protein
VWHETECVDDHVSTSIAFEAYHASARQLVARYLEDHLGSDPHWRYLPIAPAGDAAAEAELRTFLLARVDEAIAALARLREHTFDLDRAWKQGVANNGNYEQHPEIKAMVGAAVGPEDRLAVPPGKPMTACSGEDSEGRPVVFVFQVGEQVCFDDPNLFEFATNLVRAGTFTARDACGWKPAGYAWDTIQPLLEALVAARILERV